MALGQTAVRVAFDAAAVSGARPTRGLRAKRLASFARAPLSPGALVPSPHERNLLHPDEVRTALAHVVGALDAARAEIAFLLPDGVARLALLDAPPNVRPHDYASFRLAPSLPFPIRDAVVQTEVLGGGRVLAAVVSRAVIAEYEEAVKAAGLQQSRMDLAPLAGLHALRRAGSREPNGVDVVLGDAAYALAVQEGGALRVLRNRRRDRDAEEPRRLALEIDRAVRLAGVESRPRARVVGPGAGELLRQLAGSGAPAEPGWTMDGGGLADAAEVPWLGSLFA